MEGRLTGRRLEETTAQWRKSFPERGPMAASDEHEGGYSVQSLSSLSLLDELARHHWWIELDHISLSA
jgi:hypothetical protein